MYFGEVSGIAVNSMGNVFALSRANTSGPAYAAAATELLEFAADGKFMREIGHNLYAWSFAHAVKVDPQDNVWVTDKGSDMVIRFNPDGEVTMVFGRKQEASDEERAPEASEPAARPGRRAVPPGDGCGVQFERQRLYQRRLHQFPDCEGRSERQLGKVMGNARLGTGQFRQPHSIAVDEQNRIYVANRGNRRIQVFDNKGNFLRQLRSMCLMIRMRAPRSARSPRFRAIPTC